ncbi:hypothetical protein E3N88_00292 [Mikania micrantha]|uniref:Uncharacterized protein n=1 Tax=Mikania micrantha TaxID=192012 RepID=A0A5N6PZE8_9ASTR|nr:hypothetical protein E3N88_00292 [Mikania micrantha]
MAPTPSEDASHSMMKDLEKLGKRSTRADNRACFNLSNASSSITVNGWLRDFLWAQASQDPLHVRPIVHAIWDPHFGQPAVEAFTRGGAPGPVNIAKSASRSHGIRQN